MIFRISSPRRGWWRDYLWSIASSSRALRPVWSNPGSSSTRSRFQLWDRWARSPDAPRSSRKAPSTFRTVPRTLWGRTRSSEGTHFDLSANSKDSEAWRDLPRIVWLVRWRVDWGWVLLRRRYVLSSPLRVYSWFPMRFRAVEQVYSSWWGPTDRRTFMIINP